MGVWVNKANGVVGWVDVGKRARVCEERSTRVVGLRLCRIVGGWVGVWEGDDGGGGAGGGCIVAGWWAVCVGGVAVGGK